MNINEQQIEKRPLLAGALAVLSSEMQCSAPHLVGSGSCCQGQDLISQANAEDWRLRSMLHDLKDSTKYH